jgi:hypothetical protein
MVCQKDGNWSELGLLKAARSDINPCPYRYNLSGQIECIRVDEDTIGLQQAELLAADFTGNLQAVGGPGKLGGKLGRAEQTAVLESVEGMLRQEIQCAWLPQVGAMMGKGFTFQITHVHADRIGAQLEQHTAEPWFEQGRVAFGGG